MKCLHLPKKSEVVTVPQIAPSDLKAPAENYVLTAASGVAPPLKPDFLNVTNMSYHHPLLVCLLQFAMDRHKIVKCGMSTTLLIFVDVELKKTGLVSPGLQVFESWFPPTSNRQEWVS